MELAFVTRTMVIMINVLLVKHVKRWMVAKQQPDVQITTQPTPQIATSHTVQSLREQLVVKSQDATALKMAQQKQNQISTRHTLS